MHDFINVDCWWSTSTPLSFFWPTSIITDVFITLLKKSSYLKSMLLLNFPIRWSSNWKKYIFIKIMQWYLNGYYAMIFIWSYNKISKIMQSSKLFKMRNRTIWTIWRRFGNLKKTYLGDLGGHGVRSNVGRSTAMAPSPSSAKDHPQMKKLQIWPFSDHPLPVLLYI